MQFPNIGRPAAARFPIVESRSLILRVFLPFVFGYYIAYLFRTINAVMAAPLATELGLGADDLGLLTSVYFLTFAAAQIPICVLLDRYGPRRVQSALLVIAAIGSTLSQIHTFGYSASSRCVVSASTSNTVPCRTPWGKVTFTGVKLLKSCVATAPYPPLLYMS